MSHFFIESGFLVGVFCKATEPVCVSATIESGCIEQIMAPVTACVDNLELFVFLALSLLLLSVYFFIGMIIGLIIQKRTSILRILENKVK